jgi:hypothetical protein
MIAIRRAEARGHAHHGYMALTGREAAEALLFDLA